MAGYAKNHEEISMIHHGIFDVIYSRVHEDMSGIDRTIVYDEIWGAIDTSVWLAAYEQIEKDYG